MFVALLIKRGPVINLIAKTLNTHIEILSLMGYNQSLLENLLVHCTSHASYASFPIWTVRDRQYDKIVRYAQSRQCQ